MDDEPNVCRSIERILQLVRYQAESVNSGKEAIEKARSQKPNLILLDITMPELDGIEVCRVLREEPSTATIPIVMVTARYEENIIASAIESGADDYIVKPFEPQELQEKIRHTLSLAQKGLLSCQLKYNLKLMRERIRQQKKE